MSGESPGLREKERVSEGGRLRYRFILEATTIEETETYGDDCELCLITAPTCRAYWILDRSEDFACLLMSGQIQKSLFTLLFIFDCSKIKNQSEA